jgi:tetratricopeptide (TPR) repeat protein
LVASLRHPNIVRVYDSGLTEDGQMFYAMEWVHGKPLDDPSLDFVGDIKRTLTLFAKVCEAVQYAHRRGVIHRDLKPRNILIEENGEPQILDFGLAKIVTDPPEGIGAASTLSYPGQFLGSLAWASPEQIESASDQIDIRTDVYSLGVVLYQLLTGRFPHPVSSSLRQTLNDITTEPPPRPRSFRGDIPNDVETIVLRCLAKEPDRRYQTAGELARDIRRFVAGKPIDAKRDKMVYVLRKTLARHKMITALCALLLTSVLAFALTMTILYRRAVDAEHRANENLIKADAQMDVAEAVRGFLDRVLSSVDPERDGREVRMFEVLERATDGIDSGFKDQPEVEAAVRTTIGLSYRALGMLETSSEHLERALELRVAHLGEEHRETLISLNELAVLRIMQGNLTEAEESLERALEISQRRFGERDPLVLYGLSSLAGLRNTQGRMPEAESLMLKLLAMQRQTLRELHPNTIRTIHNLSIVLKRQDKIEQAVAYCRRSLDLYAQVYGTEHVNTVRTKGSLGVLLMDQDELEQAEPLLLAALEGNRRLLGDQHPETICNLHNVAVLRGFQDRYTEALELARDALLAAEKSLPRGHLMISRYRTHVGVCLMEIGRFEEAERELLNANHALREQLGERHLYTQKTVKDLIRLYDSWKRPAESAAWHARLEESALNAGENTQR